jgi:hypothetical protein
MFLMLSKVTLSTKGDIISISSQLFAFVIGFGYVLDKLLPMPIGWKSNF